VVERLREAAASRERERTAVESVGEQRLRTLREHRDELVRLLDGYEDRATGDGDFQAFIEFQEKIAGFTETLPEDLPGRETFEEIDDVLQRRRLRQKEFDRARELIDRIDGTIQPLAEWEAARDEHQRARRAVREELASVEAHVEDLERLEGLGEADLEAPVEGLRDPIETYNDAVRDAFASFRDERPAREALAFLETTGAYPLVPFEPPPADIREYVAEAAVGTEPIPQLLSYADHSRSKLDHYVADAPRFQRVVGGRRTYLARLSADPLTVDWPPPAAGTLRFRCEELVSVVDRFADEPLGPLRDLRALARRPDYDRLRDSAWAKAALSADERRRIEAGDVSAELRAAREKRTRLEAALEEHPAP
jgi:hypothetical protein